MYETAYEVKPPPGGEYFPVLNPTAIAAAVVAAIAASVGATASIVPASEWASTLTASGSNLVLVDMQPHRRPSLQLMEALAGALTPGAITLEDIERVRSEWP